MGNLGWYQLLTTAAKAVGGPKRLVGLFVAGGAVVGTGCTLLTQKVIKRVTVHKNIKTSSCLEKEKTFVVFSESTDDSGLEFKVGDKYKVLSRDVDSILIEIIGNAKNPYFVSGDFLRTISDFA